jgi:hypothetical protein
MARRWRRALREEGAATGGESRFSSGCGTGEEEGDVLSNILALAAGDEGTGGREATERRPTGGFFLSPMRARPRRRVWATQYIVRLSVHMGTYILAYILYI